MRRIIDILQPLFSEIDKLGDDHSSNISPGICGDANAARRGEALETRREIDTVAIDVVGRDDHITETDSDPELDAPALRQFGITRQ